ncbi:BrxA/BrxB family bacilliredoxin [Ectobacillus panaciterrae]|uniref:BrxA/BrxB family bacilliredoxin n=1 Tax=Ectobacillus panaciterrae TaxID=363872 RepID=UPI00048F054D|nr:BrxA/BrxB family bacilliredoxin [Ectobacillus panaciterrae]
MVNAYEEYMRQMVIPMRQELVRAGFQELTTAEDVQNYIENATGTTLVVINSVCGCAAGLARPAAAQALLRAEEKHPDHLVTVFAGQDKDATAMMRSYFDEIPPSSPSMALLKGKEVVHFIHRHEIEGNSLEGIMNNLLEAFEQHC